MSGVRQPAVSAPKVPSLIRGSAGAFLFKMLGALAGFAVALMLARYLGATQAGVFYTAMPFVMMGAYFARLGLDQLAMREVAGARATGHAVAPLVRNLLVLVLAGALVCAVLVALAGPFVGYLYHQPELRWLMPLFGLAVFSIALFNLAGQVLRGWEMIWHSSFILFAGHNLVHAALLIGLSLGFFSFLSFAPLAGVGLSYVAGAGLTALLALIWVWRIPRHAHVTQATEANADRRALLAAGQPLLIYGLGAMSFQWTDTLVLAAVRESHEVAVYNSALRVAQAVGFVLLAVVAAAGPRFAALYRANRTDELMRSYRHATKLTFIAALPPVLLLWFAGEPIMALFGDDFRSGALPLAILATGQLVNALTGPAGQLLIAAKQEVLLRNLTLAVALLNIPLNLAFAPLWGGIGAASATALSMVLLNVGAVIYAVRRLGLPLLRPSAPAAGREAG